MPTPCRGTGQALSKYFDSIPHAELLAVVAWRVVDSAILHVIKLWPKAPVIGEDEDGTKKNVGGGKANSRGTPQGGVISPLLSNCYLHLLDRIWEKHQLRWKLKARIVRYADDFVVLCAGAVDAPLAAVRQVLERLDLTLNETKTRVVDARQESFNFLGFAIRVSKSWKSGKSYAHVCPAPKSLAKWGKQGCRRQAATRKIKERMKQQTDRRLIPVPLADVVRNMNASLRGWVGYFHYRNSSKVLDKVKMHAEDRLRTHLMKRHKISDRGTALKRFPRQKLYANYGLYQVPKTVVWKTAHALA